MVANFILAALNREKKPLLLARVIDGLLLFCSLTSLG